MCKVLGSAVFIERVDHHLPPYASVMDLVLVSRRDSRPTGFNFESQLFLEIRAPVYGEVPVSTGRV
jgi:hypothetical protein